MKQAMLDRLERFGRLRLAVLGDFILDEYLFGEISRVSREAPVLILNYCETEYAPGGGANAVAGVAALGAAVTPIGVIGDDSWGEELLAQWEGHVSPDFVFRCRGHATTRKTRVLAGSFHSFRQQVVRIDYQQRLGLGPELYEQLQAALEETIPVSDAVIISDYDLGTVDRRLSRLAIQLAREHRKPIVVDSRFDPGGFPDATSVTPNISEIDGALGERIENTTAGLEAVGPELRRKWRLEALLITRGKRGMSLFTEEGHVHIPIHGSDQVADVTGAGDTVIATYTTALAAGAGFEEAARLANIAGGIVVNKKGTAVVTARELRTAVELM